MPCPPNTYTVKTGDTLSRISQRYLETPKRWPEIWTLNSSRSRSGDPNLIYPGEEFVMPGTIT